MSESAIPQPSRRRHRWLVAGIFTLAVVTGLVAVFSTWVKRQALDTGNWTNTSSQLLENKNVQNAVGAYLVDQLFSNVDVAGALQQRLPQQVQGLAGPAAAGLRELADRRAPQLLARPAVQDAWRVANRDAHKQLISILNGGGKTVSTENGEVVLDLHSLVTELASTLGVESQLAAARSKLTPGVRQQARGVAQDNLGLTLPPSSGRLVLMRAKQLQTAQDIAKLIRNISIVFTVLMFGLFALGIWLAGGWRRLALRTSGWCIAGLGLFVLLLRRVAGDSIVDGLVTSDSVKPAAHDAWNIGTSLLRAIALALLIYGLLLVVAAWLAGDTRPAVALRRALAPTLQHHPVRTYGAVGFVYLLVLVWGPTPALRHLIPILIIGALLALGVELLRRQAALEFPGAHDGDGMREIRSWFGRRARDGVPAPAGGNGARLTELERLASLHDSGALTDDEYRAQKGLLLG